MNDFSMKETTDLLTGKVLRTYRHRCGMTVKILPRPGFSRRFAAVTVPFGSIHTAFTVGGQAAHLQAGTAHFLEHCLFSRDGEGGLLGRLSGLGASANAYTSNSHTLYYFSTVHHFPEALELFLDAIFQPYLGEDRVDAEKPIILSEIDQYQDDPDTRLYIQLIKNMYAAHPVREDIGGTAESVKLISSDNLQLAWRYFYRPAVISLTMAGDFDEEPLLESLAARLAHSIIPTGCPVHVDLPDEPDNPTVPVDRLTMDVAAPSFLVGFKDPGVSPSHRMTGQDLVLRQRAGRLLLDTLLSPASPLFDALYDEGLINESFGFHYACEESFAFLVCGGESNTPDEAAVSVRDRLVGYFRQGVDEELFEIQKRAAAGDFVRSLDSVEHSGMVQAQCNLYGMDLFDYPGIYDKMNCIAASSMLDFLSQPSCCSVATLHPEVIGSHES